MKVRPFRYKVSVSLSIFLTNISSMQSHKVNAPSFQKLDVFPRIYCSQSKIGANYRFIKK